MSENVHTYLVIQERLVERIKRARDIQILYRNLGPSGLFGSSIIDEAIVRGERALKSGDVVEMIESYNELDIVK